jgi:hypothetical protein
MFTRFAMPIPSKSMVQVLALIALVAPAVGCNGDKSAAKGSTPAPGDTPAAAAPAPADAPKHKLKTKLTSKQIDDVWASMKGNHDFKNHTKTVTDKLGAPAKVDGDKSTWYGYDAATDSCEALSTSATKGSGTSSTSGAGACWE